MCHLGRERPELGGAFQRVGQLSIAGHFAAREEGLPHLIEGRVVEVLGRKARCINGLEARIVPVNEVLLDQLHGAIIGQMFWFVNKQTKK